MRRFLYIGILFTILSFKGEESPLPSDMETRIKHLLFEGTLPPDFKIEKDGSISIGPGKEFILDKGSVKYMIFQFDHLDHAMNWNTYCQGSCSQPIDVTSENGVTDPEKPLLGIRIALDPGHFAGDYPTARLERKSVQLKKDTLKGIIKNDTIIEGRLTLLTAQLLKKKLENLGATVMLTRDKDNHTSFDKTFESWWKEDRKRCLDSAYAQGHMSLKEKNAFLKSSDKKYVCREFFLQEDLRQRARKINAFDPDLAIIIHYNVDETNEGWTTTSKKNFSMCFVPGAIFPGALKKKEARFNLLRLLISDHYPQSVKAAGLICKHFQKDLGITLATSTDAGYLKDNCLYSGTPGVFSRNLALTRLPHCPVVYGETLYQDNEKEYAGLTLSSLRTTPVPSRVEQVADAYLKGIVEFFSN